MGSLYLVESDMEAAVRSSLCLSALKEKINYGTNKPNKPKPRGWKPEEGEEYRGMKAPYSYFD